MNHSRNSSLVISLGGSLIVPGGVNTSFIVEFVEIIKKRAHSGVRFFIVAGGGKTARLYGEAVLALGDHMTHNDADWIGIHTTRLNAEFLRIAFADLAYSMICIDPENPPLSKQPVVIGAGWRPGASTDRVAVTLAEHVGASRVINMSNIAYVYSEDPKENANAKKFESLTWSHYRSLIPKEWIPGLSSPFDPIASEQAEKIGLRVDVIDDSLSNIENCLDDVAFEGTIIMA